MWKTLSTAVVVLGLALSGSAFGQQWSRSTATSPNPEMKNTYNPNTFDQQKSKDEQKQRESANPAQGVASTTGSQPAAPSTESKTSEQVEKQK